MLNCLDNWNNLKDSSKNVKEKRRDKKVRFKSQFPPREPSIACIRKNEPLDKNVIDYFASILMQQSEKSLNMHNLEFMSRRYHTTQLELRERWHSVAKFSIILDSEFLEKVISINESIEYDMIDLSLLYMINKSKKKTIRHIIIPCWVSNTWIIIWIELYSFEIQILSPKILNENILDIFVPKLTDYIKNSKWFEHNFEYLNTNLKMSWDINNMDIQKIDCTLQAKNIDSGVLICYYMFAKYQGIIPINIELFSKKRRDILFKCIRKKDLSFLSKLFYSDPQNMLAKKL